jgi:beta-glucosidase-like glycosyl hydrolase
VDLNYDGVMITDAVNMKSLAAAFEHEDVYIESFLAGHDIILFTDNDYIDVMEKAVLDGRITEAQINEACRRVLDLKEKIGLFDNKPMGKPLTAEENADFEQTLYEIAKNGMTLITNRGNMIPFDPNKVKKVTIINVAPDEQFQNDLRFMKEAFEKRGIQVDLLERLRTKAQLKEISETSDIIVYACYLASSRPIGMSVYSRPVEMNTLFHSLSYGATKSVCVSFGTPSIYYNYFECADVFINAYSDDKGSFQAFVDGILGDFAFVGKTPVPLKPAFAEE